MSWLLYGLPFVKCLPLNYAHARYHNISIVSCASLIVPFSGEDLRSISCSWWSRCLQVGEAKSGDLAWTLNRLARHFWKPPLQLSSGVVVFLRACSPTCIIKAYLVFVRSGEMSGSAQCSYYMNVHQQSFVCWIHTPIHLANCFAEQVCSQGQDHWILCQTPPRLRSNTLQYLWTLQL